MYRCTVYSVLSLTSGDGASLELGIGLVTLGQCVDKLVGAHVHDARRLSGDQVIIRRSGECLEGSAVKLKHYILLS